MGVVRGGLAPAYSIAGTKAIAVKVELSIGD